MRHVDTLIFGAGLTGISTAYHMKGEDFLVIEKSDHYGGLCTSEHKKGFTFDQTGHWLHMRDERTKKLFRELFSDDFVEIVRKTFVFSHGTYTLYPFQANTYGLPPKVIKECILGFVKAQYENDKSRAKENFYEWCMAYLGEGISKHFMIPYNSKIYTVHPKDMASHWCDTYIPKPSLEEVVEGAVTAPERKFGYNASFTYPEKGGIGEMVKRLFERTEREKYLFETWPVEIDPDNKTVKLNTGEEISYNSLVSTIPLKVFLGLVSGKFKAKSREIAERLKIASVSYLNMAFKKELSHPAHWVYLPEEKYMPYRMGSFSNIYPEMAPSGKSSVYIEYTHQGEFNDSEKFIKESLNTLVDMKMIESHDDLDFADYRKIDYGYVIFHDEYFSDMEIVKEFARAEDINFIGRYGRWTYNAMENAIIDGLETAEKIKS